MNKRIAYQDGNAVIWWTRSPFNSYSHIVWNITNQGEHGNSNVISQNNVRPALVLPSNALFDGKTMLLKGVA